MNPYYECQKAEAGSEDGGWFNQMIDAYFKYLSSTNTPLDAKIIDVGCYKGGSLERLKDYGGYNNLLGVDLIYDNIQELLKRNIPGIPIPAERLDMFADNYFDVLLSSHTLEHTIHPNIVLKHAMRIAKRGLIIVPIEPDQPSSNPPHYSVFRNIAELNHIVPVVSGLATWIESKERIGLEAWLYFNHDN